jgi:hypothetical protein
MPCDIYRAMNRPDALAGATADGAVGSINARSFASVEPTNR